MRISVMDCSVSLVCLLSHYFHAVNLATSWPLTIYILIICHKPECRKVSLSFWNLCTAFKSSICEGLLILCWNSSWCVGSYFFCWAGITISRIHIHKFYSRNCNIRCRCVGIVIFSKRNIEICRCVLCHSNFKTDFLLLVLFKLRFTSSVPFIWSTHHTCFEFTGCCGLSFKAYFICMSVLQWNILLL